MLSCFQKLMDIITLANMNLYIFLYVKGIMTCLPVYGTVAFSFRYKSAELNSNDYKPA